MKKLIVANWKMYLQDKQLEELLPHIPKNVESIILCPSYIHLNQVVNRGKTMVGAQDVSVYPSGAGTGDVCGEQLQAMAVSHVIVGHSERRERYSENSNIIRKKLEICINQGLVPILCVGEKESEIGHGEQVVAKQLDEALSGLVIKRLIVAYEPVWAIGTGKIPTLDHIETMHQIIHKKLRGLLGEQTEISILYGGSVDQNNLFDILGCMYVDGVLVGKASTTPEFWQRVERM